MEREQAYEVILGAMANIQFNISLILEAKAYEAEKSRNWVCGRIDSGCFSNHEDPVKYSMEYHEQLVEVIEGITKMEEGLARNLKVVLGQDQADSSSGGYGDLGGLMGLGGTGL